MVDWKKEVKLSDLFGGRTKDSKPEKTPFWKKEISLGRKDAPALEVPEEQAPPQPVAAEAPPAPVLELVRDTPAATPALELVPNVEVPPNPVTELAITWAEAAYPSAPRVETPEPAETSGTVPPPAPAAQAPTPAAAPPQAAPQPAASAAPPTVAPPPAAIPTPAPAAPTPTPPAPPVVAPTTPTPAAEEEPKGRLGRGRKVKPKKAEKSGDRKPFYRREISFGRSRSAEKPDDSKAKQKQPKEKSEKKPAREKRVRAEKGAGRTRGKSGGKDRKLVGLKIGASQIAAARVVNNGHAELVQIAREPLDAGIVAGGELREPEALAEALRDFFGKHKLPKRGVRLGIANNRIGVRTFEISGIEDAKQLTNAIRFRAQEALPIPIEEAVLDYQVLGERVDDEGQTHRRVLLVVAHRDLIDRYMAACRKAGIHLAGIDLEAFALLRALAAPPAEHERSDAALVAVAIGSERTTFAVSDGRTCEFTRVLEWGGAALDVAIARALDVTPSEAEPFKRGLSLVADDVPEGLSAEQALQARDAVRRQIQSFARELVSSLQFYQNQPGSLGIGEIVITGGTAHLAGLAEELQRMIGVGVRVGDPLVRVSPGKKVGEPEQLGSLAIAIGLGIED